MYVCERLTQGRYPAKLRLKVEPTTCWSQVKGPNYYTPGSHTVSSNYLRIQNLPFFTNTGSICHLFSLVQRDIFVDASWEHFDRGVQPSVEFKRRIVKPKLDAWVQRLVIAEWRNSYDQKTSLDPASIQPLCRIIGDKTTNWRWMFRYENLTDSDHAVCCSGNGVAEESGANVHLRLLLIPTCERTHLSTHRLHLSVVCRRTCSL